MKIYLATVFALAMQVYSAPVSETTGALVEDQESAQVELQREKRSNYPPPVYASPCSAGSAPQISLAPHPSYALNIPSHGGYGSYAAPHHSYSSYGDYGPHYRADDENEMLSFSDMDHMAMARAYGYDAPASLHYGSGGLGGYGGHILAPGGPTGPAYGIFPNANVGSCAVPLLLSCSPKITAGKIVNGHQSSHYDSVPVSSSVPVAYRGVDEHMMKEAHSAEKVHDQHNQQMSSHETVMKSTHDTGHMTSGMHS